MYFLMVETMRIISFNVNGIRAIAKKEKSLIALIIEQKPDILTLQEIKTQNITDLEFLRPYFKHIYINTAVKKGYSGTALLTNEEATITYDVEHGADKAWNQEGRMITARFKSCTVVTVYVPNSKPGLARIAERVEWEEYVRHYLTSIKGPVIFCGDLNVAPQAIDIHNKQSATTPGASKEERAAYRALQEHFTDSFRFLHPDVQKFSWWSNFANSRERNKGWRIDMIMVSKEHESLIQGADVLCEYYGSDHCPVLLTLK